MKLIKILALATAIATVAAAQNPGGTPGQQTKPSPTPAGQQKGTPTKTSPATAAKGNGAAAKSPATKTASTATKGAVQTGVLPEKKNTTHKAAPAPAVSANKTAQAAPAPTAAAKKSPAPVKTTASAPAAPAAKAPAATKPVTPAKTAAAAGSTSTDAKKTGAKKAPASATAAKKTTPKVQPAAPPLKAKATATGPSTVAEKKPAPRLIGAAGRRDPFVSPIRSASAVSPAQNCTSGKRCLAIPELTLQGTVRDISGKMMAIVATSTHRTYTLRENDQVYNGSVEKITTDSIIFREYVKDAVGRESAKEIVKKLGPTS